MTHKKELALLEAAFASEINAALAKTPDIFQTRSYKLAQKLVADGLLKDAEFLLGGRFPIRLKGYRLTELGRMTYCLSLP